MITKVCSKCKIEKPITEYHRYKRRNETHYSQCRKCKAEYKHQNKDKLFIAQKKRRENDDTYAAKRKAWNKVYYALRTGKITKPDACSICGGKSDNIQGHHNDYSKPLDVTWCCQDCHVGLEAA